jgi:hypothetical protein
MLALQSLFQAIVSAEGDKVRLFVGNNITPSLFAIIVILLLLMIALYGVAFVTPLIWRNLKSIAATFVFNYNRIKNSRSQPANTNTTASSLQNITNEACDNNAKYEQCSHLDNKCTECKNSISKEAPLINTSAPPDLFDGDHRFKHWDHLESDIDRHNNLLWRYVTQFEERELPNALQLASAELFTEKAQIYLSERARLYKSLGGFFAVLATFTLFLGIMVISTHDAATFIEGLIKNNSGTVSGSQAVIIYFIRVIAVGGLFAGAIYFFASLSFAFFHESTSLYNRRHATRLGRLYMFIKYGESKSSTEAISQLRNALITNLSQKASPAESGTTEVHGTAEIESPSTATGGSAIPAEGLASYPSWLINRLDINAKELEEVFGWNLAPNTAFKNLKAEHMTANLYVKLAEALGKTAESLGKAKSAEESTSQKEKS